jgi:SNF2 family DNA or RNA helicase
MQVSAQYQKILLLLRNPERVTQVIPTAKTKPYQPGITAVAVPWRLDETRVLRNLGFNVPSPITQLYGWPGRVKPFNAQRDTASFLTLHERAFVLNEIGTGKTLAALWAFDYLRHAALATRLLVVSPLSTLERTWADEIFNHFPHLTTAVLHGTRVRRANLLAGEADIYLINHDGVKILADELIKRQDIDTIIIDEIAAFRNSGTERWKVLHKVLQGRKYVWGMTGTPTPNAPTDAWAQCRLITPANVPKYFGKFRDATMYQRSMYAWEPRPTAQTTVQAAMSPAVRFTRDECLDLPPLMHQTRQVEMTPDQAKAYRNMLANLKAEYAGGEAIAVNEGVKLAKLVQIACGVVYDTHGGDMILPARPRLEVLKEVVEESVSKTIVFVPFVNLLKHVAGYLTNEGYSCEVIHGSVSKHERDVIFGNFQKTPNPRILVAQPGAMSHGLTLTAAATIVWFAPITSNDIYVQANGRITRSGQQHSQLICHIEGSPVERKLYKRLINRQKLQGLLLDLIKEDRISVT